MTGPRLTLAGMLGLIALAAVGFGALASASVFWVSAVSWVLLFWLCAGLLGALFRRGERRVFWIGFALFGWIYLLLVHTAVMNTTLAQELSAGVHDVIDGVVPLGPSQRFDRDAQHAHAVRLIRVRKLADMYLNFCFAALGGFAALWFAAPVAQAPGPAPAEPGA